MDKSWKTSEDIVRVDVLEFYGLTAKIYTPIFKVKPELLGESLLYILHNDNVLITRNTRCLEHSKSLVNEFIYFIEYVLKNNFSLKVLYDEMINLFEFEKCGTCDTEFIKKALEKINK